MASKKVIRQWDLVPLEVEPGLTIDLRIKRLSVTEFDRFDGLFWRGLFSEADRMVLVRRPDTDEQELRHASAVSEDRLAALQTRLASWPAAPDDPAAAYRDVRQAMADLLEELTPTDRFIVPDEEIRRRRLLEMSADQRATYERARTQDAEAWGTFLSESVAAFVRVVPGQLTYVDDDEKEIDVVSGADLLRCFGSRRDLWGRLVQAIRNVNLVSIDQKNASGSRSASTGSSSERDQTASGESSAPTAAPAGPSAPVTSAGVTPTVAAPSGPTGL